MIDVRGMMKCHLLAGGLLLLIPAVVAAQGRRPSPVIVMEVYEGPIAPTQEFVGSVHPERRATIGSAVDGRVNEYLVREGDLVEDGQALAKLLDVTIGLEVQAAQAELELREKELEELQAGSRPDEKLQAAALLKVAEAQRELAQRSLVRVQELMSAGRAATKEDLDAALARFDETSANVEERFAARRLVEEGPRVEQILQAQARRDMQAAVVQKLQDQHKKHTIISRFRGYVVAERTEEGEWVNRGDVVAEVAALERVDAQVFVLESYVPYQQIGMEVDVWIPALSRKLEMPLRGTVVSVIPEADSRSRTFPVKVRLENRFENGIPIIKAGMLARAALPVGPGERTRLIAKDALVLGGPSTMVWVVDLNEDRKTGIVRPVPVQTGAESNSMVEILSELPLGTLVVVEGNERLQPEAEVSLLRTLPMPASPSTESESKN